MSFNTAIKTFLIAGGAIDPVEGFSTGVFRLSTPFACDDLAVPLL